MRPYHRLLRKPDISPPHDIRPGRDADAPLFIALIERCWADYPGCILDVDAEEPDLRALATAYVRKGGAVWIAGEGLGMVATRPSGEGVWEICRMYAHPDRHGTGLGHTLLDMAEAHAVRQGATRLELWTDTRFLRAHRFYEKRGYVRGARRALFDFSHTEEWHYSRGAGLPALQGAVR